MDFEDEQEQCFEQEDEEFVGSSNSCSWVLKNTIVKLLFRGFSSCSWVEEEQGR